MDQSSEEVLRQELSYLRQKLQDQPQVSPETQDEIAQLKEENKRLDAMLAGKLLDVTPGSVLFIPQTDSMPEAYQWRKFCEKFKCSIFAAPSPERIGFLQDEDLKKVGLKKIAPIDPYTHLDELMHSLNEQLDQAKRLDDSIEKVNLIKGVMDKVFDTMDAVKCYKECLGETHGEVSTETES